MEGSDRTEPLLQPGDGGELWHGYPGVPRSETADTFVSHSEPPGEPPRPTRASSRKLGTLAVLAIVFFNVSGGPLGSEGLVFYGGPLPGLLTLMGIGVFFSLPQSLMTAELSSAFPDNGGYSLWVQAAFGDFWAVQESYWSWFSGVVDSALYPVLLYSSVAEIFKELPVNLAAETAGSEDEDEDRAEGDDGPVAAKWALELARHDRRVDANDLVPPLLPHIPPGERRVEEETPSGTGMADEIREGGEDRLVQSRDFVNGFMSDARVVSVNLETTEEASGGTEVTASGAEPSPTRRRLKRKDARRHSLFECFAEPGATCTQEYGYKLAILAAFSVPNIISSKFVGHGLVALGIFVLFPYAVMALLAFSVANPSNLLIKPKKFKARAMLSVAYWSLSGFDCASTFAGEVADPGKTMPRALLGGCALMLLSYLVPLSAGAMADPDWPSWKDGSLAKVAASVGGSWLGGWVLASSALSNWGLYASELLEDSFQLLGMAEVGLAPSFFASRSSLTHTPIAAIAFQLVLISLLLGFDFHSIMCIDNFFSAAAAALEFAAAVQLRRSQPSLARPFRVPFGTAGVAALYAIPFAICIAVCITTAMESPTTLITTCGATAVGLVLYIPLWRRTLRNERQLLRSPCVDGTFVAASPHTGHHGSMAASQGFHYA